MDVVDTHRGVLLCSPRPGLSPSGAINSVPQQPSPRARHESDNTQILSTRYISGSDVFRFGNLTRMSERLLIL